MVHICKLKLQLREWSSEDTAYLSPPQTGVVSLGPPSPRTLRALHTFCENYIMSGGYTLGFSFLLPSGIHFISNVAYASIGKKGIYTQATHSVSKILSCLKNADLSKNIGLINPALKIKQKM